MSDKQSNNKRIAKNALLLYFRMLFMMAVSLYTSRVVLSVLGVEDFGIYNVVAGVVVVLSFLNTSMASATQRFLNVELGRKDDERLKRVFNTSQIIHVFIACIIFILAETVGVWFLNSYMVIAPERMEAANWVFQFSIVSFMLTVISVPYNAAIIAHEKMSAFAYISVVEVILKLLIVYLLLVLPYDKLVVYACLMALISIVIRLVYGWYCSRHFEECKSFSLKYDKLLIRQMLGFSGWTVFGALGSISHTQGIAIVMNMFFGVAVNAALGIANQVTNVVNNFVTNFMTALNPQIVKTYAANEFVSMHVLIKRGSRMGICLVAFFAIPLILETPIILNLWLKKVPEYTVIFIRLILLASLCNAYASPLAVAKGATGNIKIYQLILTTLGWLHLPLAWIFFEFGCAPYYAMYIYLFLINLMQACRIYMVCESVKMSVIDFCKEVLGRCTVAVGTASVIPFIMHKYIQHSISVSFITIVVSIICMGISCYVFGMTKMERDKINTIVRLKFKQIK